MGLFTREELCDYIRAYHADPDRVSDAILTLFDKDAERISIQVVESSAVVSGRQTKRTTRYMVQAATPLERELDGGRITFIDVEDWEHETHQA